MKIAIIQFPGSNCETESLRAIKQAGMEAEEFLWNQPYAELKNFAGYFIVGGFSYEDRSRAGVIASLDPIMNIIKEEAKKGKPVLGVCNGAQILVETGLVPGAKEDEPCIGLSVNKRTKDGKIVGTGFYNTWVNVKMSIPSEKSAFTRHLWPNQILHLPIAHAEGKFVMSEKLLQEVIEKDLSVFRYCNQAGETADDFPTNPNGAVYNLAAVTNVAGNIMAIMPHPERTEAGQPIFTSIRDYIKQETKISLTKLNFTPSKTPLTWYQLPPNSINIETELIINDNEAKTVTAALRQLDIHAEIKKYTHWEINYDNQIIKKNALLKQLSNSGELYNRNKEIILESSGSQPGKNDKSVLIKNNDNIIGQEKKQTFTKRLGIAGIKNVSTGTIWKVSIERGNIDAVLQHIVDSGILYNQQSQKCYLYNHMDYGDKIRQKIDNCTKETSLNIGKKRVGKVRDSYELDDKLILVTTDRQSAFDRVLAAIPFKGQVLNQISAWWFERTKHIVDNHVIATPHPNITVAKKCTVFPVEFVVRSYLTGTTSTSIWTNYQKGIRNFGGKILPEGMVKNQKLDSPIITPTTKNDIHDKPITAEEIIAENLMTEAEWNYVSQKALALFEFGQQTALEHGLILVDTKYEFGKDQFNNIFVVDELHTPDSSRYWLAHSYQTNIIAGQEPENIDKEFLRLWFIDNCDPYNDTELPQAPEELIIELSKRYIQLYEMITGQMFDFPEANTSVEHSLKESLLPFTSDSPLVHHKNTEGENFSTQIETKKEVKTKTTCVILLGSDKDEPHALKITSALDSLNIPWEQHVASAHKQAREALEIIENNKDKSVIYITIAGRSNALSGFVAGNSNKVTIACPPFQDKTDMLVNIHSTIQMPSKVPVMTILEPENVALAILRITNLQK